MGVRLWTIKWAIQNLAASRFVPFFVLITSRTVFLSMPLSVVLCLAICYPRIRPLLPALYFNLLFLFFSFQICSTLFLPPAPQKPMPRPVAFVATMTCFTEHQDLCSDLSNSPAAPQAQLLFHHAIYIETAHASCPKPQQQFGSGTGPSRT